MSVSDASSIQFIKPKISLAAPTSSDSSSMNSDRSSLSDSSFYPAIFVQQCQEHSQSFWTRLLQERLTLLQPQPIPSILLQWALHNLLHHLHMATMEAFIQQHWQSSQFTQLAQLHLFLQHKLQAQSAKHPLSLSAPSSSEARGAFALLHPDDPCQNIEHFLKLYMDYIQSQKNTLDLLIDHTLHLILPIAMRRTNITRIHPGTLLYKAQLYVLSQRVLRAQHGNIYAVKSNLESKAPANLLSVAQMRLLSTQNPKSIGHHLSVSIDRNTYHWVELLDPSALVYEGIALAHCSASYSKALLQRTVRFFSLRSNKGMPLLTMEIIDGKIGQLRGKAQRLMHSHHVAALNAFLQKPLNFKFLDPTDCQDILDAGFFFDPKTRQLLPFELWNPQHVFSHDLLLSASFQSRLPEGFICSGSLGISSTYVHPLPQKAQIHHLFIDHHCTLPTDFRAHILTAQTLDAFCINIDQARAFNLTQAPHVRLVVNPNEQPPEYLCANAHPSQILFPAHLVAFDTDMLTPAPWRHHQC